VRRDGSPSGCTAVVDDQIHSDSAPAPAAASATLPDARAASLAPAFFAFAAICIIWGTTFVAIRVAIETIPTLLVTGSRFVAAGLMLLLVGVLKGARFPRRAIDWRDQTLSGILMVGLGNALVVYAEHVLSSGLAALLAATIPIWLALMESLFGAVPLSRRKSIGLALGFGGVGLLVAPAIGRADLSLPFFLAVGAMQVNAVAWNAGTLYQRRRKSGGDPITNAVIQMLAGGSVVCLFAMATGSHVAIAAISMRSAIALAYLTVFGSVIAYTAYLYALTRLSPGKVSSYAYVNPLVAVIFGSLLLREPVTLRIMIAMVVILAGVAVIQLDRRLTLA
jgi:drug/metabolite transporter (DMT)-like permease